MKKERTFNQEVEHFCRLLEAEIVCFSIVKINEKKLIYIQ